MSAIIELSGYHWLILGMLLLAAEALGAAGFLIGAAVAALATGIAALLSTYLYLTVFRQDQRRRGSNLNKRSSALVGHQFVLDEAITLGAGRVQIGDTFWQVETEKDLPAGTRVQVVAAEPMKLQLASME